MEPSSNAAPSKTNAFVEACDAFESGVSLTNAAALVGLARSTFYYKYRNRENTMKMLQKVPTFPRTKLTMHEEDVIVSLCLQYSDQGHSLSIHNVQDAAEIIVATFPLERRKQLRSADRRPRLKWIAGLRMRHFQNIFIGGPSPKDAVQWAAANATVLTTHIASIEDIVRKHKIPPTHIANLDETGITPNRDTKGKLIGKVMRR